MATTTDILAFLKADQEARKIEREEEKQLRVKERKEDVEGDPEDSTDHYTTGSQETG